MELIRFVILKACPANIPCWSLRNVNKAHTPFFGIWNCPGLSPAAGTPGICGQIRKLGAVVTLFWESREAVSQVALISGGL